MDRCTVWCGEHAAVYDHSVNYIDRLARYEDTGLTPEEVQRIKMSGVSLDGCEGCVNESKSRDMDCCWNCSRNRKTTRRDLFKHK